MFCYPFLDTVDTDCSPHIPWWKLHCVSERKHVTTFSTITWTISFPLQLFLALGQPTVLPHSSVSN